MSDLYAVMGHPIAHSKSPLIHAAFARQSGQDLDYSAILAPLDAFGDAVAAFRADAGKGLNITLPFKEQAWAMADQRSPRAQVAGAVNTLMWRPDGALYGDNTDGPGLVRDLVHGHGIALQGRRLLLLGAGGASRGVIQPLLAEQPASLVVANRTAAKALALADHFDQLIEGCGLEQLAGRRFDVIINATSASLQGQVPAIPDDLLAPGGSCYDMMYGDRDTAFVDWGRAHAARICVDGLGMLVEQAAESFLLWRGVRPDTRPVIAALRSKTL